MNFKLISVKEVESLYPNNYNEESLKRNGLKDNSLNTNFRYIYSNYRCCLDFYINQVLDLKSIEEKANEEKVNVNISFLYKNISSLNYNSVFIRNNLFIDRLTKNDIDQINDGMKNKDINKIFDIVKETFKKVIAFDEENEHEVVYDVNIEDHKCSNKALVLGVLVKDKTIESFNKFLKEKEEEFSKIMNIPVKIFTYDFKDVINYEIYSVENLNEEEEKANEELLKANPKYLPIGSIVILKGATKKLMIVGHKMEDEETHTKYDYIGYVYPEGFVGTTTNIGFNHEDISRIYAIGLIDKEQRDYLEIL